MNRLDTIKSLRNKRYLPLAIILIVLVSGVVIAQIFSNQLSYQVRVRDDNERYILTELSSSFNDMWGAGQVSFRVHIEKIYDPGVPKLYAEIVNLDGLNISASDFTATQTIWDGDGHIHGAVDNDVTFYGGNIIQGINASTVIVYSTIQFASIDTPYTMSQEIKINFLLGISAGDYQITLYVFSS